MRGIGVLVGCLVLAGCATPPQQWEKAGTDRETAKKELGDCRRDAKSVAWRSRTDYGPLYPRTFGRGTTGYNSDYRDPYYGRRGSDSFLYDERRLTVNCMHDKGYELNPVPTNITPKAPPRST